jgi:hypothetical protein
VARGRRQNRRTSGWLTVLAAVVLVVIACVVSGNGNTGVAAVIGFPGLFGLLWGFIIAGTATAEHGARVAKDEPLKSRQLHSVRLHQAR